MFGITPGIYRSRMVSLTFLCDQCSAEYLAHRIFISIYTCRWTNVVASHTKNYYKLRTNLAHNTTLWRDIKASGAWVSVLGLYSALPAAPTTVLPQHRSTRGRVTPENRWFLQVERGLGLCHPQPPKTIVAFNQRVPRCISEGELETLIAMLDIPRKIRLPETE